MTKILFLPHCLNKEQAETLKKVAEEKDYKVYIVGGGSIIKKILSEYKDVKKIVGVACKEELKLAKDYTKEKKEEGTEIKPILLITDGCKDTKADLNKVLKAL